MYAPAEQIIPVNEKMEKVEKLFSNALGSLNTHWENDIMVFVYILKEISTKNSDDNTAIKTVRH